MSLQNVAHTDSNHPLVVELGLVTVVLVAAWLWWRLAQAVTDPLVGALSSATGDANLLAVGLLSGGVFVGGLALLAGGYAAARDVDVGLALPSREDLPLVGLAVVAPVALVGLTKLVGVATGVTYGSLTQTSYAPDPPLAPVLTVVALGLVVGVPTLVLLCQVVVQGGLARILDGRQAVLATTFATGFVMLGGAGGLETVPDRGKLAGAVLFVVLVGLALVASERTDDRRLRALAAVPLLVLVAVVLVSTVLETDSVADGLFGLAHLAVLGLAAATYERTGSLVAPALAYLSLTLSNTTVVLVFEAGVGI